MSLAQFLAILGARWRVMLAVFAVVVGGTLAASLLMTKLYTGVASVVIEVRADPITGLNTMSGLTQSMVETQVDIIQSDRVATRVVRALNLTQNELLRQQWLQSEDGKGDLELWIAETLRRNLDVRPSRNSGVVTIAYRAQEPRFAAAMANAFARAYLDVALELRVEPARRYAAFFDQRVKEARDALEQAQAKATQYQRDNGLIASDERLDIETARLTELSSQLVALQAMSSEATIRQRQSESSADTMQEVLGSGLIASLKAELTRAEARVQELTQRLGDRHPQIIEARAAATELRERIEAETRKVIGGVGVSSSVSRKREAELAASLQAQRTKVLRLKAVRDESVTLQREVENAQRLYDQVVQRQYQSSLESQTNQALNLSLLGEARPPVDPSSPRVVLNTALSVVLGLALAVAAAMAAEALGPRVRLPQDAIQATGLPLLAALPRARRSGRRGAADEKTLKQRLLPALSGRQRRLPAKA